MGKAHFATFQRTSLYLCHKKYFESYKRSNNMSKMLLSMDFLHFYCLVIFCGFPWGKMLAEYLHIALTWKPFTFHLHLCHFWPKRAQICVLSFLGEKDDPNETFFQSTIYLSLNLFSEGNVTFAKHLMRNMCVIYHAVSKLYPIFLIPTSWEGSGLFRRWLFQLSQHG